MQKTAHQAYHSKFASEPYDAIVIGSGIGGLSAAAFLARAGKRVLVLERHTVAGGFTHTFTRKGYEWDVGVHYIGEVHRRESILRKVFDAMTEGRLEWSKMPEVYDKVYIEGDSYELVAGARQFKERLCSYFPQEHGAIERYLELIFDTHKATRNFFANRALPPWLGEVTRPFMASKFFKYSDRTTKEVISGLTSNQKLIGVLTAQYGDYGLPPARSSFAIHAMVVKHYLDGGNYPVGGSGRIYDAIAPMIEKNGGRVLVKAEVERILIEGDRAVGVSLNNGDEMRAPIVISDAGVLNTFGKLIPKDSAERFGLDSKLKQVQPSLAHICLYVGMKKSVRELNLGQANYWIYPGYDHDESIRRYTADPQAPLPIVYISFPSAKDPSWEARYPGRSTLEVIGFTPYDWFSRWENTQWKRRGPEYEEFKAGLSSRLLEALYQFVPQVKGHIDYHELSSPLSTRHFCNYDRGEIYGIDHAPERFRLSWLRPQTPIKNLFLTGQDIVTDGVVGALFAGVLTASAILKKNLIRTC